MHSHILHVYSHFPFYFCSGKVAVKISINRKIPSVRKEENRKKIHTSCDDGILDGPSER